MLDLPKWQRHLFNPTVKQMGQRSLWYVCSGATLRYQTMKTSKTRIFYASFNVYVLSLKSMSRMGCFSHESAILLVHQKNVYRGLKRVQRCLTAQAPQKKKVEAHLWSSGENITMPHKVHQIKVPVYIQYRSSMFQFKRKISPQLTLTHPWLLGPWQLGA